MPWYSHSLLCRIDLGEARDEFDALSDDPSSIERATYSIRKQALRLNSNRRRLMGREGWLSHLIVIHKLRAQIQEARRRRKRKEKF